MNKIDDWILEILIWLCTLLMFGISIYMLTFRDITFFLVLGSILGFFVSSFIAFDRIQTYRRIRRKANELTVWDAVMQRREHPLEKYWTVQEFLEFYEVLKVANLLEIYYDACPDFRRIAIRMHNLFGKE